MKCMALLLASTLVLVLIGCRPGPPPEATLTLPTLVTPSPSVTLMPTIEPTLANQFPLLEGEYFGQGKPGLTAEPFAPHVFSDNGRFDHHLHSSVFFSPSGQEVYFMNQSIETLEVVPLFMKQAGGVWAEPRIALLAGIPDNVTSFVFSPDWSRLYLYSSPSPGNTESHQESSGLLIM